MATFPGFVRGRDLLFCYVGPISIATDQTFSIPDLTSDMNMAGYIDFVQTGNSPSLELIQSVDIPDANYENAYDDFTTSLGEIIRKAGVNGKSQVLLANVLSSDALFCQYGIRSIDDPEGEDPVSPTIITVIGARGDFGGLGIQNVGKNSTNLVIRPKTWANMGANPLQVGNVTGITRPFWVTGV